MESVPLTAEPLWQPDPDKIKETNLARFQEWLRETRSLDLKDHRALYDWSVRDLECFWSAIAEFFDVQFFTPAEQVIRRDADPIRTKWFPGGTLNYAEHLLRFGQNKWTIPTTVRQSFSAPNPKCPRIGRVLTRGELVTRVQQLASALKRLGVQCGDRVAGFLPNRVETLIAFLATASLGAIWSNCPPELSSRGVIDRLSQIEPKVLVAVTGYRYGGKSHDRATALVEIAAAMPTLRHVILLEQAYYEQAPDFGPAISILYWTDLIAQHV